MSLDLTDLGITAPEQARPRPTQQVRDPGTSTLRDAATPRAGTTAQGVIADLGVHKGTTILRDALSQIWGARPDLTPIHVLLLAADSGQADIGSDVEALGLLAGLVLPERTAVRVLELARRRTAAFLGAHPAWQARLADQGCDYEEMERRTMLGEFDESGPLASTFDLEKMAFRA